MNGHSPCPSGRGKTASYGYHRAVASSASAARPARTARRWSIALMYEVPNVSGSAQAKRRMRFGLLPGSIRRRQLCRCRRRGRAGDTRYPRYISINSHPPCPSGSEQERNHPATAPSRTRSASPAARTTPPWCCPSCQPSSCRAHAQEGDRHEVRHGGVVGGADALLAGERAVAVWPSLLAAGGAGRVTIHTHI